MNNTIQTIALIVIIGIISGCFEGIKYPIKLSLIIVGVILAEQLISKKEGYKREEETKIYKVKL